MAKINVCVHLYLQADSEPEGRMFAREVEDQLRLIAPIESSEVKPYWKIPDYYGVFALFAPVDEPDALYESVLRQADGEWQPNVKGTLDAWAVWNCKPGLRFLSDRVRWAHVFFISVADNLRFSLDQPVRMTGTSPKTEPIHAQIGTISSLPSSDDKLFYGVFFFDREVWCVADEELEAID